MMTVKKINSKLVETIGYDAANNLLKVKFKISGRIYAFIDVQKEIFEDFLAAKSKPGFFNKYIKHNYPHFLIK